MRKYYVKANLNWKMMNGQNFAKVTHVINLFERSKSVSKIYIVVDNGLNFIQQMKRIMFILYLVLILWHRLFFWYSLLFIWHDTMRCNAMRWYHKMSCQNNIKILSLHEFELKSFIKNGWAKNRVGYIHYSDISI